MTLWDYGSNTTHNLKTKLSAISAISAGPKNMIC